MGKPPIAGRNRSLLFRIGFFTIFSNTSLDEKRFFQETRVPVLMSEGKCLRWRARSAHLGEHLPAAEATSVWPSELPDASQAGSAMRLAMAPQGSTISNHQKFGRPRMVYKSHAMRNEVEGTLSGVLEAEAHAEQEVVTL